MVREGWIKILGQRNIIKPDDCNVLRNTEPGALDRQNGAHGNDITGNKNGSWTR